jgi:hypothetical protein
MRYIDPSIESKLFRQSVKKNEEILKRKFMLFDSIQIYKQIEN